MSVPLLRTVGGKEPAKVGLEATGDGGAPIMEAVVLPLPPDEALGVAVFGFDSGRALFGRRDAKRPGAGVRW